MVIQSNIDYVKKFVKDNYRVGAKNLSSVIEVMRSDRIRMGDINTGLNELRRDGFFK